MSERIFVRIVGFSDVERHALNSLFRLSEERDTIYTLWVEGAPEAPRMALIDGQSSEAAQEMAPPAPGTPDVKMFWVGPVAPAQAARTFQRPLHWPEVVQAMDEIFAPPPELDFDLDIGGPPATQPHAGTRVLVIDPDPEVRLYWRAKFAGLRFPELDEAATAAQARDLIQSGTYLLAIVSLGVVDADPWDLVELLRKGEHPVTHVAVATHRPDWPKRIRARVVGCNACLDIPPSPGSMVRLLRSLRYR